MASFFHTASAHPFIKLPSPNSGTVRFFQAFGDPGDYQIWFDLVPVNEDGEAIGEETTYGPYILIIHEDSYVEHRGWKLLHLPFAASGRYEMWLWYASDVLAREQFLVREA